MTNNTKSIVAKNLEYLMARHRLNPTQLAAATHQNQPTLHRILSGESPDPRLKTVQPYADYFGINVNDLRTVDLETGAEINVAPTKLSNGKIPVLSWVQAGDWGNVYLNDVEEWRSTAKQHSSKTFALKVRGISMYNPAQRESFQDGDIILVDPDRPADNGSLVIAMLENTNESTFKKLYIEDGKYYLKPLNPSWQPQLIELKDATKICGVVFEKQVDF